MVVGVRVDFTGLAPRFVWPRRIGIDNRKALPGVRQGDEIVCRAAVLNDFAVMRPRALDFRLLEKLSSNGVVSIRAGALDPRFERVGIERGERLPTARLGFAHAEVRKSCNVRLFFSPPRALVPLRHVVQQFTRPALGAHADVGRSDYQVRVLGLAGVGLQRDGFVPD